MFLKLQIMILRKENADLRFDQHGNPRKVKSANLSCNNPTHKSVSQTKLDHSRDILTTLFIKHKQKLFEPQKRLNQLGLRLRCYSLSKSGGLLKNARDVDIRDATLNEIASECETFQNIAINSVRTACFTWYTNLIQVIIDLKTWLMKIFQDWLQKFTVGRKISGIFNSVKSLISCLAVLTLNDLDNSMNGFNSTWHYRTIQNLHLMSSTPWSCAIVVIRTSKRGRCAIRKGKVIAVATVYISVS